MINSKKSLVILGVLLFAAFVVGFSSDYSVSFLAATKTPVGSRPSPDNITNKSNIISVKTPTKVTVGQSFAVEITIQNMGIKWSHVGGYQLGSQNPPNNNIWGVNSVGLSENEEVLYRQNKTFLFNAIAPSQPGTYDFQWQMNQNGNWFGEKTRNKKIKVITGTSTQPIATTPVINVYSPKEGDKWFIGNTYRISWRPFSASSNVFIYLSGGGHEEGFYKYVGSPMVRGGEIAYLDYRVFESDLPVISGSSWRVLVCNGKLIGGGKNCGWSGQVTVAIPPTVPVSPSVPVPPSSPSATTTTTAATTTNNGI